MACFLLSVHPRACGEQGSASVGPLFGLGSSPRLRGTEFKRSRDEHQVRFIPAPAGNSLVIGTHFASHAVHPRACGEQLSGVKPVANPAGSSPRLRGTECDNRHPCSIGRFIPAPAGNRPRPDPPPARPPVHPRACGEQKLVLKTGKIDRGSSPRLRGTACEGSARALRNRFIPAPAGNSCSRRLRLRPLPVHPRACGEQGMVHQSTSAHDGSSPRLRGTVLRDR